MHIQGKLILVACCKSGGSLKIFSLLVLSATFMSCLKELVEPEQLKRLLVRTISFLIQSENASILGLTSDVRCTFKRSSFWWLAASQEVH
jgi:hypothetical protein